MPYPSRDPGANPRVDRGFRLQSTGGFGTAHFQARSPTAAEQQARRRNEGSGQPGSPRPVWVQPRNGMPDHKPYVRAAEEDMEIAEAERAWHRVALVQARLRGEPDPVPMAEPWNRGACPGCGFRMRCGCPPRKAVAR